MGDVEMTEERVFKTKMEALVKAYELMQPGERWEITEAEGGFSITRTHGEGLGNGHSDGIKPAKEKEGS
jgi:hypothetical protein